MGDVGAVRPYQAASVADLAGWPAGAAASDWWRLVAEFLEEYRHEPLEARSALLAGEPASVGDERWDVFLAGLAEHLSARDGHGAPAWTEDRVLRRFWFPFDSAAARVDAVVHAPAALRRRGVFVAAHELDVA